MRGGRRKRETERGRGSGEGRKDREKERGKRSEGKIVEIVGEHHIGNLHMACTIMVSILSGLNFNL